MFYEVYSSLENLVPWVIFYVDRRCMMILIEVLIYLSTLRMDELVY